MVRKTLPWLMMLVTFFGLGWAMAPLFGLQTRGDGYVAWISQHGIPPALEQVGFSCVIFATLIVALNVAGHFLRSPSNNPQY